MPTAAFISDIHANLEALTAVLEDIRRHGYEETYCLGDVVGYGPDPVECTDLVRRHCVLTILGNHDEALVKGAWGFNQVARNAMEWTRKRLRPSIFRPGSRARWQFLASLPLRHEWHGHLLVHGSPREPTSEYILPRDADWSPPGMFQELFSCFESVCLVGHTHMAGVFEEGPRFIPQAQLGETFRKGEKKIIVNVGAVGQPRDHDWRACYLSIEEGLFRFHRVEYPVEATQRKIRAVADLDNRLADRLGE
ncbi:MAG: metallophosphoesterase family protein, partial [Planctomycetes bacterium]|nr:metallophosphoesterase family protein [Planctomycetota bacterium]